MTKLNKISHSLSFRIIGATIFWLWLFSFIISGVGYVKFTQSLTKEYNDSAFRTAQTALSLINGDCIESDLQDGGSSETYKIAFKRLDLLCQNQETTLIYVIVPDTDYKSFRCVYNVVNHNSHYAPWTIGYERETTNEEYEQVYRDIYENGLERGVIVRDEQLRGNEPHITSLVPVKNSYGEVTAIMCVQRPMEELDTGRRSYLKWVLAALVFMFALSSVSAILYLRQQFVNPLKVLIGEAERFARDNTKNEDIVFDDVSQIFEINKLGTTIEKVEKDMLSYMDELTAITAEKERIGTELALATQIQASMLPSLFPAFPEREEINIFASMSPAKEVGGDFYDFFLLNEDQLGIVMADVSGKGIPAALFMMMTKILLQNHAFFGGTPGEVLARLNDTICTNNPNDMFVTVWFGILTISERKIVAANAGHEYPVIKKEGGEFEIYKDKHGIVIGGMEGVSYQDYEIEFGEGDMLFLYTDGVPEATNASSELFGVERMISSLNSHPIKEPKEVLATVKNAVEEFVGEAPQFDDLTMLSIKIM